MKQIGSVEVPQEAFMAVLKMDDQDNAEIACFQRKTLLYQSFEWRKSVIYPFKSFNCHTVVTT